VSQVDQFGPNARVSAPTISSAGADAEETSAPAPAARG
jgi:hypothetical protein